VLCYRTWEQIEDIAPEGCCCFETDTYTGRGANKADIPLLHHMVPLTVVNLKLLVLPNWQACRPRVITHHHDMLNFKNIQHIMSLPYAYCYYEKQLPLQLIHHYRQTQVVVQAIFNPFHLVKSSFSETFGIDEPKLEPRGSTRPIEYPSPFLFSKKTTGVLYPFKYNHTFG
jgi:hypothetical protein